jgi:phosphoglycerate dehydrogenase-like enzyme
MTDSKNRQWMLKARPAGKLTGVEFLWNEAPIPRPSDGQALIRTLWLSVDPAQRIWMARDSYKPAVALGDVMQSFAVGQVIESRHPDFKPGDLVRGDFSWQDYVVTDGKGFGGTQKVAPGTPPNLALSLFGVNGLTSYFGMIEIGKIKVGETVVVSGAAGATGSVAGQIAKIKMTWALILASVRHLVSERNSIRAGGWQTSIGQLEGRVLGVLGLGNIGGQVARIGLAFGMKVIAWSQNLTPEVAAAAGAVMVTKNELFQQSDIVTIHLILSDRTRGLVGAADLALMKPTARLINTSRGPIVDEQALIRSLRAGAIAGAAIDVFDVEPLPAEHPFRSLENVLATGHVGFVAEDLYRIFYGDAAASIAGWLEGQATSAGDKLGSATGNAG